MTLFVEQFDTSGAINTTRSWVFYGTEDENGTRLQVDGGYCGFDSELMAITLRTWPRRESHFRLNFMDGTGKVIGSMRVANPVKGPFPVWSPQPLPQTRTNGPIVLTLRSVRESHPNSLWPAVRPNWGLSWSDPQWRWADVRSVTFHDATGNEGRWLPRDEPALKAAVLVYRRGMDDFLPAERIIVENVAIPKTAEFVALDQTFERAGVKIILQVLVGESGRSTSSNGRVTIENWGSDRTLLKFETQNQQADDVIELILRDDLGEILKVDFSDSHSYTATNRTYRHRFSPPAEAKSISIEMAVNRPLPFEFIFSPHDIQAPLPAK